MAYRYIEHPYPDLSHRPSGFKWFEGTFESKHILSVSGRQRGDTWKTLSRVRAWPPEPDSSHRPSGFNWFEKKWGKSTVEKCLSRVQARTPEPDSSDRPSGFNWFEEKGGKSTLEKSLSRVRARPPEPDSFHRPSGFISLEGDAWRRLPPIFIRQKAKELLIYAKNTKSSCNSLN